MPGQKFSQSDFDQTLASFMASQNDMVYLLNTYGIYTPKDTPLESVQLTFLKGIKDSQLFRNGVADYMTKAIGGGTLNFAGAEDVYLNEITTPGTIDVNYSSGTAAQMGGTSTSGTSSTSKGTSWFGSVFSSDTVKNLLNTGLGALSTKLASDANQKSEQNALVAKQLEIAQLQEQQRLAAIKAEADKTKSKGMPGWGWALIGVGIVTAITIITVVVVKRGRARRAAAKS